MVRNGLMNKYLKRDEMYYFQMIRLFNPQIQVYMHCCNLSEGSVHTYLNIIWAYLIDTHGIIKEYI